MDTQPLRDLIEALELRRLVALSTTLGVVLVGLGLSYLAPGIIPPHPLVGAAVGLAALTIGVVAAVAADAGDEVVRGSRHVRATGAVVAGERAGLLEDLVDWVEEHAADSPEFSLAIVGAGAGDGSVVRVAEAIAETLALRGRRVLVADLSRERGDAPGLAEVGRGEERLSQAVTFSTEMDLARIASGSPLTDALVALPRIAPRLRGDVEVLVAALPGLRQPGTLLAATAAGRSLMLVTEGRTSRVEVIAGLQALDAAAAPADLVLVPEGGIAASPSAVPAPSREEAGTSAEVEDASASVDEEEPEVPDLLPDPADELVTSDDLGAAPFEPEDDWTEPLEPITPDDGPGWEPAGDLPTPFEPDREPEPEPEPDPDPFEEPPPAARSSAPEPPPAPETSQPELDLSGEIGSARAELQHIASVIALEREVLERDDDHDTDGVA